MRKVAYNGCFGGFSLSREAVEMGRQISGDPKWAGIALAGESYADGSGMVREFGGYHLEYDFPRHDAVLIQVIESLGAERASGAHADLGIVSVDGPYRIDEYDGAESVETPDSDEWVE